MQSKSSPLLLIEAILVVGLLAVLLAQSFSGGSETAEKERMPEPEVAKFDPEQRARVVALADSWTATPRFKDSFYALEPSLSNQEGGVASIKFNPMDDYWGLPRSAGHEEVAGYCAACHSLEIVMQQNLTRERWQELLVWMQEKQGMPELDEEEHGLVLDYLYTNFGAQVASTP